MEFTNEQLQKMISKEPIGDMYPYNTKDREQIESYIQELVDTLNRSETLKCEAMFDHYGSGYASYVDLFCYKRNEKRKIKEDNEEVTIYLEGLVIYISRLAPVAIIGQDNLRSKTRFNTEEFKDGLFSSFCMMCEPEEMIDESPKFMTDGYLEIKQKLADAGYSILHKEYLSQPLPFKTEIQTSTDPSQYKVFDAIFYWMD